MGYKITETALAGNFNYQLAMYKGKPVQLLAVQQNTGYEDYGRRYEYKLYARNVGSDGQKFKIDYAEPTLSVDACQVGYCLDSSGKLAFLEMNCGKINRRWSIDGFVTPDTSDKLMYNCVMGISPTFKKAFDEITKLIGRKKAMHFDRDFALVRDTGFSDISIHYRGVVIGTYESKTKRIVLRKGPTVKLLKRKLDRLTKDTTDE